MPPPAPSSTAPDWRGPRWTRPPSGGSSIRPSPSLRPWRPGPELEGFRRPRAQRRARRRRLGPAGARGASGESRHQLPRAAGRPRRGTRGPQPRGGRSRRARGDADRAGPRVLHLGRRASEDRYRQAGCLRARAPGRAPRAGGDAEERCRAFLVRDKHGTLGSGQGRDALALPVARGPARHRHGARARSGLPRRLCARRQRLLRASGHVRRRPRQGGDDVPQGAGARPALHRHARRSRQDPHPAWPHRRGPARARGRPGRDDAHESRRVDREGRAGRAPSALLRQGRAVRWWADALLRRYASGEAAAVAPHVRGRRVLDLGAAEGWVAAALGATTSVWACGADVGPHRRAPGAYVVYDGARLPFGAGVFDTTLALLPLHHWPAPGTVLAEAVRVTRQRLIVTESVWRTRLERFWLVTLDGRLNGLRHEGRMAPAVSVRRPEQWRELFRSRGLTIAHEQWLGSRCERLVHHPLLVVLDVPGAARSTVV